MDQFPRSPSKRDAARLERDSAISGVQAYGGPLAERLKKAQFPTAKAVRVRSILDTAARAGHDPSNLVAELSKMPLSSLDAMLPSLEATARAGYDPSHLVRAFAAPAGSRGKPNRKGMPQAAEHMRRILEAASRSGGDPRFVSSGYQNYLANGFITRPQLAPIADVVETASKSGKRLDEFAHALPVGFKSKVVNAKNLGQYAELHAALPQGWKMKDVLMNAEGAKELKVPLGAIPQYQKMLVDLGHYPQAALVADSHQHGIGLDAANELVANYRKRGMSLEMARARVKEYRRAPPRMAKH